MYQAMSAPQCTKCISRKNRAVAHQNRGIFIIYPRAGGQAIVQQLPDTAGAAGAELQVLPHAGQHQLPAERPGAADEAAGRGAAAEEEEASWLRDDQADHAAGSRVFLVLTLRIHQYGHPDYKLLNPLEHRNACVSLAGNKIELSGNGKLEL